MKTLTAFCFAIALTTAAATPASAQDDTAMSLSFRPFAMFSGERFAASNTFNAIFGSSTQTLWGGGLNITQDDRYYLEFGVSRFKKTGQRVFVADNQVFPLGTPLTASVTPLELTGGYRFLKGSRIRPYAGGGIGIYKYKETSQFALPSENVDASHVGGIIEGGAEVRLHEWISIAGDVHYTYVPGILGDQGVSLAENEKSLGGVSFRAKVIIGK